MVTVGKKINALGSGILTMLFIYSIFMAGGILVYNFMIFPLVIIVIFFGFDSEEDIDDECEDEADEGNEE